MGVEDTALVCRCIAQGVLHRSRAGLTTNRPLSCRGEGGAPVPGRGRGRAESGRGMTREDGGEPASTADNATEGLSPTGSPEPEPTTTTTPSSLTPSHQASPLHASQTSDATDASPLPDAMSPQSSMPTTSTAGMSAGSHQTEQQRSGGGDAFAALLQATNDLESTKLP